MDSFRIHPAIGIARVGNSEEYFIAPESMAGSPAPGGGPLTGGLPIRAGTESDPIRSGDVRDAAGALKRQAARFRVFAYPPVENETWPRGDGVEVTIGSSVDGKTVKDIIWTVHLANKKANNFILAEEGVQGIDGYRGIFPPIRNPSITDPNAPQPPDDQKIAILSDPARVRQLIIDPGPRAIAGANAAPVAFDAPTVASYFNAQEGQIAPLPNYPKSFPGDGFPNLYQPSGPIDTLGQLITDAEGRLLVLGGYGKAVGWPIGGNPPLPDDVNNNQWFDDASDGPVSAVIVFSDNSVAIAAGAWVTATDPSYAPQILNVVSLWDDIYDCWVRDRAFGLAPQIYDETNGGYQQSYKPTFDDQLSPIFQSAALQQWVVNLNTNGIDSHGAAGSIKFEDNPAGTILAGLGVFRYPNNPSDQNVDPAATPLMPLHLGDSDSFLTLRQTQLFFLQRWNQGTGNYSAGSAPLGPGEYLDKATLVNCLGGRFSPGIDLTFVMREPSIYTLPWQSSGGGPFRLTPKALNYAAATSAAPLLGVGYVPQQNVSDALEPGDLSKFMALPWHTDYNSCATHPPSPNPPANNQPGAGIRVFWSWPAQRPVAVYTAADAAQAPAPVGPYPAFAQRWSVRGPGTESPDGDDWGRYQTRIDMLANWNKIGVIMQAPQIDPQPSTSPAGWYLEVQSQLGTTGDPVPPYPNFVGPNQNNGG